VLPAVLIFHFARLWAPHGGARKWNLPASSAVGTASSVEASATMETAPTMEASAAVKATSCVATSFVVAMEAASPVKAFPAEATSKVPAFIEVAATVKPRAAIKAWSAVETVEPRAGADKNTAGEVPCPVVAVRRACVRIISIVAVLAHWGWTEVRRADANADHDSLCMCVRRRQ
jgi:hypothetical protein